MGGSGLGSGTKGGSVMGLQGHLEGSIDQTFGPGKVSPAGACVSFYTTPKRSSGRCVPYQPGVSPLNTRLNTA